MIWGFIILISGAILYNIDQDILSAVGIIMILIGISTMCIGGLVSVGIL